MELYFVKTLHSCSTSGLMYMSVRGLCAKHKFLSFFLLLTLRKVNTWWG